MFNVHKFFPAAAVAAVILASAGCSGNKERIEAATSVLTSAQRMVEAQNYDSALVYLDTLDHKYRDCLEQRRQGTLVRIEALAAITRDSLAIAKINYTAAEEVISRLSPNFKQVTLEGTDGYWVDKAVYTGGEMNRNSVQLRVDEKGYMFMVVNVSGRIGLDAVKFGDVEACGRSVEIEGSEIMSLHQEAVKPLVDALTEAYHNDTKNVTLTLAGKKSSVKVKLDAKQLASIAATDEYALALQQRHHTSIVLEKLERRLNKLNDQMASQIPDPVDE